MSALYEQDETAFRLQAKAGAADGEGGITETMADDANVPAFMATVTIISEIMKSTAAKESGADEYKITTTATLARFDIIKRVSDGAYFEIKSDPKIPPSGSELPIKRYKAERWKQ